MDTTPTPSTPLTHDDHDEGKTATEEKDTPGPTGPPDARAPEDAVPDTFDEDALEPDPYDQAEAAASAGAGTGAAAVVAAGLGVVSLSGSWTGRVVAERETLIGQINASQSSPAQQIAQMYGDAWHSTALVNGLFAVLAVLVGVFVLVRPAFGAPAAHPQPGWIRSVARAGIALGAIGVLISVGMYIDFFLPLPSAG
ncbi:hypothetical protein OG909_23400 [Streptomyces sp. NBC_01754]|uniref:hypothetical protein n=1 Tax=Streptomyces sp. NBC_01754 TaxID=2975930 RepID=UPI002DDBEFFD|nr:hypothetical protein [Streptomyces sp. NBC_01754]WSC94983.1 hypothetical protein OG909_23400 [Streptomyces sp. NBC_01754]